MYCRVLQLFENGHLLPNHRLHNASAWREGLFYLEQRNHQVFHRTLKVAKLIDCIKSGGLGDAALPFLYDACVVVAQDNWFRISGIYFDDHSKHALAQTWHVEILGFDYRDWAARKNFDESKNG